MDELFEKMKKLIAEKLDVDEGKITLKASFRQDLGVDSLDAYELGYAIEEAMGVSIPDEKVNEFETVKDAYDFIKSQMDGADLDTIEAAQIPQNSGKAVEQSTLTGTSNGIPWKYTGGVLNGMRHGKGKTVLSNGEVIEGDWVDDLLHGKGKYTYPDGEKFEGDWVNGKKTKGKYTFANGDVYVGDFLDGKFIKGKLTKANGTVCNIVNGKPV